ncbi:GLPGLI family protein [Chryseobacterium sp. RG1]|uniref:GLPGLI family protein n=1 Tax=Chryseobacterium tagetis TaxID=2801334 RepID=A0ABS8A325_9FLAO|nr:GLPGLI family protein [Chryseobacterium tagetis]MCA6068399.1 GLPGLI family protein [Chryseobacterium tagetis]
MKKILSFTVMLISFFYYSQTNRFFYELKSRKDSTQDYKQNIMVLDINPKSVKFYDKVLLDKDSINKNNLSGEVSRTNTGTDQLIVRDANSYTNKWYRDFFEYFVISTTDKMKWELSKETITYEGYTLQKATTDFGGRKWTAWFADSVNIPEGPYKFRGLPGLIFLLKDSQENFVYKLVKNTKFNKTYDTSSFLENHYDKKAVKTNVKNFNTYLIDIYNNPTRSMSENIKNGNKVSVKDADITSVAELNQKKKMMQKMIKNRYIYLEQDKQPKFD